MKIRDEGLLDTALNRPINLSLYEEPSLTKCAAAYVYGIIRNYPFFDGNKRTGFITAVTFLLLNDHYIECSEVEVVLTFISLAGGELAEEELEEWFEKVTVPHTQI